MAFIVIACLDVCINCVLSLRYLHFNWISVVFVQSLENVSIKGSTYKVKWHYLYLCLNTGKCSLFSYVYFILHFGFYCLLWFLIRSCFILKVSSLVTVVPYTSFFLFFHTISDPLPPWFFTPLFCYLSLLCVFKYVSFPLSLHVCYAPCFVPAALLCGFTVLCLLCC